MRTFVTSVRHFCYAIVATASFTALQAQQPALKSPAVAPRIASSGDLAKPIPFRTTGSSIPADSPVTPAVQNTPVAPVAAPSIPAPTTALEPTTGASMSDRRETIAAELQANRSRMEATRRRAEVMQSLGKSEEATRLQAEASDLEARIRIKQDELTQLDEEISRARGNVDDAAESSGEEVILPGNNIELWVNEDTSFNGRYQVRRGGYVILPQVGRVQVAGKTIAQAESTVRKALQATQLRRATVMIERFEGVTDEPGPMIYLSGEFHNPRPYRIPQGTAPTLVSVILASGGVTPSADLTHVKVMRMAANRSLVEEVNVKKILDGTSGGLGNDITLTEGDVVVVPSGAMNLVYVTGRVKKPGSYRVDDNERLTVYGAILQSGGFDHFASLGGVHVLRAMPDGTKAKLPVSIKDVQKGQRPDIVLQPNDIVVVPEKWFSW